MQRTAAAGSSSSPLHHDVTVIGAGWSGLLAVKYALEEGLTVTALERRDNLGGLWYYSDDPAEKTVMKSTIATSSSSVTEMSDFPMPEEIGMFPNHEDMLAYLHSYAKEFNLYEHIHFNTTVEEAKKDDGGLWKVRTACGQQFTSRFLMVCVGQQQLNREVPEVAGFQGAVHHAAEIKEPLEEHRGKRLLIVGGGETAADICSDWYNLSNQIYWSIPRGQHFFRRYTKILPWGKAQALDKASSRALTTIAPYHKGKPGLSWICKWTTNGSLLAYQGHGIKEWRNEADFFHFFINKNGKVLDLVDYKKVVPKGPITTCDGNMVTFADGSTEHFDVIILCTGYSPKFPFLPDHFANKSFRRERYKLVFDNDDPSLAFVGFVRPVVGSVPGMAELQARWAAKVFSNHVALKSKEARLEETDQDAAFWTDYFKDSSQRLETLVEAYMYVDDIARQAGVYPDLFGLFKRNPQHWFTATFSPYNGALYRLNEPKQEKKAIANLKKHGSNTIHPVHLLLLVILRLIWFDFWLKHLEILKFKIQSARWWPTVSRLPPVRAANWVWCTPKRLIFDTNTSIHNDPAATRPRQNSEVTATHNSAINGYIKQQ